MNPRFLNIDEVLHLHQRQLEQFGGSPGIRDLGALQSALAMPESGMGDQFFHKDFWEMVAAYLFHICQMHPFVGGNKRVALASSRYFLHVNGHGFVGESKGLLKLTLDTASGKKDKAAIAAYFKAHSKRRR
jgi:death-on-curing protein